MEGRPQRDREPKHVELKMGVILLPLLNFWAIFSAFDLSAYSQLLKFGVPLSKNSELILVKFTGGQPYETSSENQGFW